MTHERKGLPIAKGHSFNYHRRMDWKKLITEILESGMTQGEIARALDISQPVVHEMATGKRVRDPQWTHGNILIALHAKRCRPTATESP
jgi:hypothetical protein